MTKRIYRLNVSIEVESDSLRNAEDHITTVLQKAWEKDRDKKDVCTKLYDFDFYLRQNSDDGEIEYTVRVEE